MGELNLDVVSFRAMKDQEESIIRDFKTKIAGIKSKSAVSDRWMRRGTKTMRVGFFGWLTAMILMIFDSDYTSEVIWGVIAVMFLAVAMQSASLLIHLSTKKKELKILEECDTEYQKLWGNKKRPTTLYRYDEYLDEFEIHLKFDGSDQRIYVGRVESHDDLAKNFNKTAN